MFGNELMLDSWLFTVRTLRYIRYISPLYHRDKQQALSAQAGVSLVSLSGLVCQSGERELTHGCSCCNYRCCRVNSRCSISGSSLRVSVVSLRGLSHSQQHWSGLHSAVDELVSNQVRAERWLTGAKVSYRCTHMHTWDTPLQSC